MRRLAALLLALLLALPAAAQVRTDAAGLRELAARLLDQGDAAEARDLARALVARDARDVAGLILLARAELALGDAGAALEAARAAHGAATGTARYVAARLAARAHAERGEWTRAQIWLRRARADAPDRAAVESLARDYRVAAERNPLRVTLSFGAAPSSNVNGGSASSTITLPGLPFEFELSGDARALSGFRLSAGVNLSYRLRAGAASATFLEVQASGRTYVLSAQAQEQAPDARGSDYADVSVAYSLVQRWGPAAAPRSVSASLGQTWYDGDPYLRFLRLSADRGFALGARDRLDLSGFLERQERIGEDVSLSGGGRLAWMRALASRDRLGLSAAWRDSPDAIPDVSYAGATLGASYGRGALVAGLRLGASVEGEWRGYDASRYAEDGREDWRATARATLGLPRLDLYGFEPTVTVEASRTWSDVSLYDRDALTVDLGFRSSF